MSTPKMRALTRAAAVLLVLILTGCYGHQSHADLEMWRVVSVIVVIGLFIWMVKVRED